MELSQRGMVGKGSKNSIRLNLLMIWAKILSSGKTQEYGQEMKCRVCDDEEEEEGEEEEDI